MDEPPAPSETPVDTDIDAGAAAALQPFVGGGETLLWAGRPDAARYCRTDPRLVLTGVFWCAVSGAAFWGFSGTFLSDEYDGLPFGLRVFGLLVAASPFLAVAAYTLGGHVLVRRRRRARTAYGVTDRRVLALRPGFGGLRLAELARAGLRATRADDDVEFHDLRGVEEPLRFECLSDLDAVRCLAHAEPSTRSTPS